MPIFSSLTLYAKCFKVIPHHVNISHPQTIPQTGLNYCSADWHTYVPVDEGFYDCTMGICPRDHRRTVDD
jgi:hypothetical protein